MYSAPTRIAWLLLALGALAGGSAAEAAPAGEPSYFSSCAGEPLEDADAGAASGDPLAEPFLLGVAGMTKLLLAHKVVDLLIDERCAGGDRGWVESRWAMLRKSFFVRLFWGEQAELEDPAAGAA